LRITIIFALLASLIILLRSGMTAWQFTPGPGPHKGETVPESVARDKGAVDFSYVVPQPLPDLHKGYLFNAERSLVIEEVTELEPDDKDGTGETDIDFDTVSYAGSIITGDLRKALVTYSVAPPSRTRSRSAAIRSRNTRTARAAASQNKHAQLALGDTFSGYKVVDIKAEKIIFQRDEEQIEKLLHDPEKQRLIVPSPIAGINRKNPTAVAEPENRKMPAGPPAEEKQQEPQKAPSDITPGERQPVAVPERRSTSNPRRRLRSVPPEATQTVGR